MPSAILSVCMWLCRRLFEEVFDLEGELLMYGCEAEAMASTALMR